MSRGLGPVQRQALDELGQHPRGLTAPQLSAALNVEPRRGRALVSSLKERGLVEVDSGPGTSRLVRLPAVVLSEWRRKEFDCYANNAFQLTRVRRAAEDGWAASCTFVCPDCGCRFDPELSVPVNEFKLRPAGH
jgi:MarR family